MGAWEGDSTVFPNVSPTPLTAPPAVFATPVPTPCTLARMPFAFSRCSGGMLAMFAFPG